MRCEAVARREDAALREGAAVADTVSDMLAVGVNMAAQATVLRLYTKPGAQRGYEHTYQKLLPGVSL